jgi:hypothetical protein
MPGRREKKEHGGFAARLRAVVQSHGSANGLARAIQRSEGAVRKWLRAESEPNVTDLRSVCEHTQTSIVWLVTGHGQREAPPGEMVLGDTRPTQRESPAGHAVLNTTLLEGVLEAIEEELRNGERVLPSSKRSVLVAALYDICQQRREVDREAVARLVRLACSIS